MAAWRPLRHGKKTISIFAAKPSQDNAPEIVPNCTGPGLEDKIVLALKINRFLSDMVPG
jgi:hypothetical protein